MKKYCDLCGRLIGEAGKLYISGTICRGHNLTLIQYVKYRVFKFLGKVRHTGGGANNYPYSGGTTRIGPVGHVEVSGNAGEVTKEV